MEQITKTTSLNEIMQIGKDCRKCGACCKHASGFLVEDDLKGIAKHFDMLPEDVEKQFMEAVDFYSKTSLKPKTMKLKSGMTGQCIFLGDKNECKIHDVKPLQCKIGIGCKEHGTDLYSWFVLNYFVDAKKPETVRQYAHYLRAGGKVIPGGSLRELIKDEAMLKKILGKEVLTDKHLKV